MWVAVLGLPRWGTKLGAATVQLVNKAGSVGEPKVAIC